MMGMSDRTEDVMVCCAKAYGPEWWKGPGKQISWAFPLWSGINGTWHTGD